MVAVARDQNPPIVIPRRARAIMRIPKFGASAIRSNDPSIIPVSPSSTWRRSRRPAMVAMNKLVATAKRPETEIAWPAIPSVAWRSVAIGVSRLTGMNSEAISIATHKAIEPTALHACRLGMASPIVIVVMIPFVTSLQFCRRTASCSTYRDLATNCFPGHQCCHSRILSATRVPRGDSGRNGG
jgi:hypothetical protein